MTLGAKEMFRDKVLKIQYINHLEVMQCNEHFFLLQVDFIFFINCYAAVTHLYRPPVVWAQEQPRSNKNPTAKQKETCITTCEQAPFTWYLMIWYQQKISEQCTPPASISSHV